MVTKNGHSGKTLRRSVIPYGLLAPGTIWRVLFFLVPLYFMAEM